MKRAQKPKGSVVFNKARSTWNLLWFEGAQRKSRKLGTLADLPTRADALKRATEFQRQLRLQQERTVRLVVQLVEDYRIEKMPTRYSTRRGYEVWLRCWILPRWGNCTITELQSQTC